MRPDGQDRFDEPANTAMVATAAAIFVLTATVVLCYLTEELLR